MPAANHGAIGEIRTGTEPYPSWYVGTFSTEVGVFVNVLEHTGNIQLHFAADSGAGVLIEGAASQRWQHWYNSKGGWGGWQSSHFSGESVLRESLWCACLGTFFWV